MSTTETQPASSVHDISTLFDETPCSLVGLDWGNSPYNMAADEWNFFQSSQSMPRSFFRIYSWDQPGITLGYFQKYKELYEDRLQETQLSITRRITGGMAILHFNELTYGYAISHPAITLKNRKKLFTEFSTRLAYSLIPTGWHLAMARPDQFTDMNAHCHHSISGYELTNQQGEKKVGSASMVRNNTLFVQGSIPLDRSYEKLAYFLKGYEMDTWEELVLDKPRITAFAEKWVQGIQDIFKASLYTLTDADSQWIQSKQHEYEDTAWIQRK